MAISLPQWIDAHNHLQDSQLAAWGSSVLERMPLDSLSLVNGTSPQDWELVADAARQSTDRQRILPAYGIHPWYVSSHTGDWQTQLDSLLQTPDSSLGEIGLDRWVQNSDFALQVSIFQQQLEMVEGKPCPITFHCLKAWPDLYRIAAPWLRKHPRPFLLHAYSGPSTEVPRWIELGAYFSFSPYFLHERKASSRILFQQLPEDRILIETDAPSMAPPDLSGFQIHTTIAGQRIQSAGNIIPTYRALADLRSCSVSELQAQIQQNFQRFYFDRSLMPH